MTANVADVVMVPVDDVASARRVVRIGALLATQLSVPLQLVTVVSPGVNVLESRLELLELGCGVCAEVLPPRIIESNDVGAALGGIATQERALLCMGTRGRGALGSLILGSTAFDVVADSTRPIVLVGPRAQVTELGVVLVALRPGSATSTRALAPAAGVASRAGATMHVIGVVAPNPLAADEAEVERAIATAVDHLHDLVGAVRVQVVGAGDVADAILWAAEDVGADLIAMATHGRGPLERLALGSIAQQVVHRATCPVLVVPPGAPR
jgi:nucleotide-binding universal stress UspA family protein